MTPLLLALKGLPLSGKSTFADFLESDAEHECFTIDDAEPLRYSGAALLGIDLQDCYSQEGKLKPIPENPDVTVRKFLGDLGEFLESYQGSNALPILALKRVEDLKTRRPEIEAFVFPSVRRAQGDFYKEHGGFVIEIQKPNTTKENTFDFDTSSAKPDVVIINDGSLTQLKMAANLAVSIIKRNVLANTQWDQLHIVCSSL